MKRTLNILMAALPLIISCGKAAYPGDVFLHLLTGECLNSTELKYTLPDGKDQQLYGDRFVFGFMLDVNSHTEEDWALGYVQKIRPTDEIFDEFGSNQKTVRKEYDALYETYATYCGHGQYTDDGVTTLLYNGGISLTADKDFAGYSAGEDLGHLITGPYDSGFSEVVESNGGVDPVISTQSNIKSKLDPIFNIPLDYISMAGGFGIAFNIPMGDCELTEEEVTFELNIPVKVVMYLNWINDKISNPEALVPYEDKVLHCTFTTRYGLR